MSGAHYGDFPTNHTSVCMVFDSFAGSTGAPSATSNFAAGDIQIYKDGGTTQRSSSAGITVSTSFDSSTGLQMVVIDLSDNTDSGFYAAGHEYSVAVADVTIDSQTVRFWLGSFSIERAGGVLALLKAGTAKTTLADGVAHGGTLGSSTATLALSRLSVVSQSSNTAAITATGNGSGVGAAVTGGATNAAGMTITAGATNANGMTITGTGTGHGISFQSGSGSTGNGVQATSNATNGTGLAVTGKGTGHGIHALGGDGSTGNGILAVSQATNGHGIAGTGTGTGDGARLTGGGSAGGDGLDCVAGGGVDIRGNQTGNLVGTVSTLTTYTGNTPQTGDTYALANGASGFAAIAGYIDTEVAAIKTQTDKLTFTVSNQVDCNLLSISGSATAATNVKNGALGIVVSTASTGSTTTSIVTNLTETTDDHYNGRVITFTSGALLGQSSSISDYTGSTKTLTVVALTEAPANTDGFVIT